MRVLGIGRLWPYPVIEGYAAAACARRTQGWSTEPAVRRRNGTELRARRAGRLGPRPRATVLLSRDFLRYLGPGFIVTLGFIDPGNWATDIAAGSRFGYELLWVISLSTLVLILFQSMAARLGIVTGHSLAYNIRERYAPLPRAVFGVSIVLACVATDVAELIGAALGINLLFGLPLWLGACLTIVMKVPLIVAGRYHQVERLIVAFLAVISICYLLEILLVHPDWAAAGRGAIIPRLGQGRLLVALGMMGAVVMPSNIYLHSNVILSRDWTGDEVTRRRLISYERGDTILAMSLGWLVNCAMVIVAAAVFFRHGIVVASLEQASATLEPLVGHLARFVFAVALLCAGLGSSVTASMAEANVITAYLGLPEDPRSRAYRLALVATALPALAIIAVGFSSYHLLVLSQVVLGVQLPLTIVPLLLLVNDRRLMGTYASGRLERFLAVVTGVVIVVLDVVLVVQAFGGV